jgi:hypothetical protein
MDSFRRLSLHALGTVLCLLVLGFGPSRAGAAEINTAWSNCQASKTSWANFYAGYRTYACITDPLHANGFSVEERLLSNGNLIDNHIQDFLYGSTGGCPGGGTWNFSTGTCNPGITPEAKCLALNKADAGDPDGRGMADRLYIVGTAPTVPYCSPAGGTGDTGGCLINVYLADKPDKEAYNPFTGGKSMWTTRHQEATGGVCSTKVAVDQDGNPANSMVDSGTIPQGSPPATWSCNYMNGTCTDPKGDLQFCTFSNTTTNEFGQVNGGTRNTCVPATGDADGDGIPNDRDTAPTDPTNGKDTTGTESDNVSSGGGNCNDPPHSSGDGIAAQVAYQTWATRCAVDRLRDQVVANDVSGNALNPADQAKLSAIQASTSLMTSKQDITNSKLDTVAANAGAAAVASNSTTAAVTDLKDKLTGTTTAPSPGDGAGSSLESSGRGGQIVVGGDSLDTSGFATTGSCPTVPDINVFGRTIHFDLGQLCAVLQAASFLVVLSATLLSLRILGGAV